MLEKKLYRSRQTITRGKKRKQRRRTEERKGESGKEERESLSV